MKVLIVLCLLVATSYCAQYAVLVANSPNNPIPGTIYNKPTGVDPGFNVYAGCVIDYKGKDVTAANFLAVIKGFYFTKNF